MKRTHPSELEIAMAFRSPYREEELRRFICKLGFPATVPLQWELLDLALTHPSADPRANYERLEFLGDAALKLAAAQFLYTQYPTATEGSMSALRDVLVSDRTLAQIGERDGLERYLLLGGAIAKDAVGRESRIAEALEAVLGVFYLADPSLGLIRTWLEPHFQELAIAAQQDPAQMNYKGALQELTQRDFQQLPEYRIMEMQQARSPSDRFVAEVWVAGSCQGRGSGPSKKTAEQEAARLAFLHLQHKRSG